MRGRISKTLTQTSNYYLDLSPKKNYYYLHLSSLMEVMISSLTEECLKSDLLKLATLSLSLSPLVFLSLCINIHAERLVKHGHPLNPVKIPKYHIFDKICDKLVRFQKYLSIFYFLVLEFHKIEF